MEEGNKIPIEYAKEHSEPKFSNHVVAFQPLSQEIFLEFNCINDKLTWKSSEDGKRPTKVFVDPVCSIKLNQLAAFDLAGKIAEAYNFKLVKKEEEPKDAVSENQPEVIEEN